MVQMVVYHPVIVFSFFSFLLNKIIITLHVKIKMVLFFFFFASFFSSEVGSGGKPCFSRSKATQKSTSKSIC
jgi:hypothetical protein